MKDDLIRQIRQIYRERNYRAYGKPLEEYREEHLREHLAKLQGGSYPWMRKGMAGGDAHPTRETAVCHH